MKEQETLQEAAKNYAENEIKNRGNDSDKLICSIDFINGAKWDEERRYSEEDLRTAFTEGHDSARMKGSYKSNGTFEEDWNKWFEQFKKK